MAYQINQILKELYQLDPDLKKYESELIKVINKILISKPNTRFDKAFAKKLRAQLLAKTEDKQPQNSSSSYSIINLFTMKKISYVAGGAVLVALIIIPVLTSYLNKSTAGPIFNTDLRISNVEDNAFGRLEPEVAPLNQAGAETYTADTAGIGAAAAMPRPQSGGGGGLAVTDSAKMIAPDYIMVNYNYVYNGEIAVDQEKMAVLKRIRNTGNAGQITGLLTSFDLGLADLSNFSGTTLQNVSFAQEKPYGYIINVNLEEGALTIHQNWRQWPEPDYNKRLKASDIPADEKLIKLADDFLSQHNISLKNYSQGIIDDEWENVYARGVEMYIPDIISVIYPLEINGKKVYEGHGYPVGINVMIKIRENRVSGVTNLFTQNYQSSMYETVTDTEKIKEWVKRGGIFSYSYGGDKTYNIDLGEPEVGYFRKWNYKNGENEELLVPALIFPVTNQPQFDQAAGQMVPYFNKRNVVVPIIKEVLAEFDENNDFPPTPIPLPANDEPIILEAEVGKN